MRQPVHLPLAIFVCLFGAGQVVHSGFLNSLFKKKFFCWEQLPVKNADKTGETEQEN